MKVTAIAAGPRTYSVASWNTVGADAEISRNKVEQLLAQHGAIPEDLTSEAKDLTSISEALGKWRMRVKESHIIYWVGHGEYDGNDYRLALANSGEPLSRYNALACTDLSNALYDQQIQRQLGPDCKNNWVLLILETCGSGPGAWQLYRTFAQDPYNVGVIAAADDGAAYVGHIASVLEFLLNTFTPNDSAGISPFELMRRLEDNPDKSAGLAWHHKFIKPTAIPLRADSPPPVQAPVDVYQELREIFKNAPHEVVNHFYAKAQGSEIGELAWYFTGRENERREVSLWLQRAAGGMFVVSGVAGSGKSALVGMLLATANDAVNNALAATGYLRVPDDLRPAGVEFNAVIHLSGRTIAETIHALSTAFRLTTGEDVDALLAALGSGAQDRRTVLVDALDESRDPLTIAAALRRLAALPGMRVLVGTRQSLHEDPDHPIPRDSAILDTLAADQVIKLQQDADAVRRYVSARLRSAFPSRPDQEIGALADTIADYEQPFLFARLAVREIIADPDIADNKDLLAQVLGDGHSGIFGHAVTRLSRDAPEVEALLHVLTYARGNGFPRTGGIWAIAASELAPLTVDERHLEDALRLAAPFIMQDSEFGCSVYRLAHRTFAEWYLKNDAK
jgi:hypothetical protein